MVCILCKLKSKFCVPNLFDCNDGLSDNLLLQSQLPNEVPINNSYPDCLINNQKLHFFYLQHPDISEWLPNGKQMFLVNSKRSGFKSMKEGAHSSKQS